MVTIVSAVGEDMDDLFMGVREFPTDKVILISCPTEETPLEKTKDSLEKFKIPTEVIEVNGKTEKVWMNVFKIVRDLKKANRDDIVINSSSGCKIARCSMTSAAFVNGIKAFGVCDGEVCMLPILKFSYYKLITDRKMKILELLYKEPDCCASLEELSKRCSMSLPLVSYHVNGNPKSEGLKEMALVETIGKGGRVAIKLSLMGKLLMNGYVD